MIHSAIIINNPINNLKQSFSRTSGSNPLSSATLPKYQNPVALLHILKLIIQLIKQLQSKNSATPPQATTENKKEPAEKSAIENKELATDMPAKRKADLSDSKITPPQVPLNPAKQPELEKPPVSIVADKEVATEEKAESTRGPHGSNHDGFDGPEGREGERGQPQIEAEPTKPTVTQRDPDLSYNDKSKVVTDDRGLPIVKLGDPRDNEITQLPIETAKQPPTEKPKEDKESNPNDNKTTQAALKPVKQPELDKPPVSIVADLSSVTETDLKRFENEGKPRSSGPSSLGAYGIERSETQKTVDGEERTVKTTVTPHQEDGSAKERKTEEFDQAGKLKNRTIERFDLDGVKRYESQSSEIGSSTITFDDKSKPQDFGEGSGLKTETEEKADLNQDFNSWFKESIGDINNDGKIDKEDVQIWLNRGKKTDADKRSNPPVTTKTPDAAESGAPVSKEPSIEKTIEGQVRADMPPVESTPNKVGEELNISNHQLNRISPDATGIFDTNGDNELSAGDTVTFKFSEDNFGEGKVTQELFDKIKTTDGAIGDDVIDDSSSYTDSEPVLVPLTDQEKAKLTDVVLNSEGIGAPEVAESIDSVIDKDGNGKLTVGDTLNIVRAKNAETGDFSPVTRQERLTEDQFNKVTQMDNATETTKNVDGEEFTVKATEFFNDDGFFDWFKENHGDFNKDGEMNAQDIRDWLDKGEKDASVDSPTRPKSIAISGKLSDYSITVGGNERLLDGEISLKNVKTGEAHHIELGKLKNGEPKVVAINFSDGRYSPESLIDAFSNKTNDNNMVILNAKDDHIGQFGVYGPPGA